MGEALGHQKYFWGMQAEKSPTRKFFLQTCGFEMVGFAIMEGSVDTSR